MKITVNEYTNDFKVTLAELGTPDHILCNAGGAPPYVQNAVAIYADGTCVEYAVNTATLPWSTFQTDFPSAVRLLSLVVTI